MIAWFTAANLPGDRGYPMLGFAVAVGCVVHLLGDMITKAGVPILWPIPIGRRMWRMIGVPNGIAVRVGGKAETVVLRTALHGGLAARGRRACSPRRTAAPPRTGRLGRSLARDPPSRSMR